MKRLMSRMGLRAFLPILVGWSVASFFLMGVNSFGGVTSPGGERASSKLQSIDGVLTALRSAKKDPASLINFHREVAANFLTDPKYSIDPRCDEVFEILLTRGLVNQVLATQVLTKTEWFNKPMATEWAFKILYRGGEGAQSIVKVTLAQELWANEKGAEIARYAIGKKIDYVTLSSKYFDEAVLAVLKTEIWQKQPTLTLELAERLILANIASPAALIDLLKMPALARHPVAAELLAAYSDTLTNVQPQNMTAFRRLLRWFRVTEVTGYAKL